MYEFDLNRLSLYEKNTMPNVHAHCSSLSIKWITAELLSYHSDTTKAVYRYLKFEFLDKYLQPTTIVFIYFIVIYNLHNSFELIKLNKRFLINLKLFDGSKTLFNK